MAKVTIDIPDDRLAEIEAIGKGKGVQESVQELVSWAVPEWIDGKTGHTHADHEITALDAVRLLCTAIQKVHHLDKTDEGIIAPCHDTGEYMLADALHYLAYGDTFSARSFMELYDEWKKTGKADWPYVADPE